MKGIEVARIKLGLHELRDRYELMEFIADNTLFDIDPSETPWCAAFVNACEGAVGNPGTGKLNARSFLTYGKKVDPKDVKKGDIVVFSRGGSSWQGHVAYYVGADEEYIKTLGGNQGDEVKYSYYAKDRVLGYRRYE